MRRPVRLVVVPAFALGALARPARAAPATFVHPGVTVSQGQLDFARGKVKAGVQPWKNAFDQMLASKYADLDRTPKARAVVECGAYSNPDYGCTDEREDGRLVGGDHGPHQQQRAAPDRLGGLLVAQGR